MGAGELICEACGSRWYSAAAEQMVCGDTACPSCGAGPLTLADDRKGQSGTGGGDGEEAQI
jgi:ribosomal protein S27AE